MGGSVSWLSDAGNQEEEEEQLSEEEEKDKELVTITLRAPIRRTRRKQKKRTADYDDDDVEDNAGDTNQTDPKPLQDNGGKRSRRIAGKDPEIQVRVYGKEGDPPDSRWRKRTASSSSRKSGGDSAGESRRVRFVI